MKNLRLLLALLLAGGAAALVSCADPAAPRAPEGALASANAPALLDGATSTTDALTATTDELSATVKRTGLLTCRPLPETTVSQVVGRAGGTIRVGPHSLVIPRNALARDTRITAHLPSDRVNRVEFQPHGLEFAREAKLTMSYANCYLLGSTLPKRIAYIDANLNILELLLSVDNLRAQEVSTDLQHFSEYAVAW
jgi:hypothetical protein